MSVADLYRNRGVNPLAVQAGLLRLPVDANTVGLWWFNEGSGTTLYDKFTTPHAGTISGAAWGVAGPWRSSLTFPSRAYVSLAIAAANFGTGSFTVEVVASEPTLSGATWNHAFVGGSGSNYWLLGIRGLNDTANVGSLWWETCINSKILYFGTPAGTRYDNTGFHYFAATINRTTPLTSLYIDGVSKASNVFDYTTEDFNTITYLSFGQPGDDANNQMYGSLCLVRFSNVCRSAAEILANAAVMGFA